MNSDNIVIQNSDIANNSVEGPLSTSAGGIHINGTFQTSIMDTLVHGNVAGQSGGGFFIEGNSIVLIQRTNVFNNKAHQGAGYYIATDFTNINILDSTISFNNNPRNLYGAGFYFVSTSQTQSPTGLQAVRNCTIMNNYALQDGAALYINNPQNNGPILVGLTIKNNDAGGYGGGIYLTSSKNVTLINCTLQSNNAVKGSGIYCNASTTSSNFQDSGNLNSDKINCATDCSGLCTRDVSSSQPKPNNPNLAMIIGISVGAAVLLGIIAIVIYRHFRRGQYTALK